MERSISDVPPQKYLKYSQPILVYIGLLIYFGVISFLTDRLSGNDSYFHIKYAWLLWKGNRLWDFPWLQGTSFRDIWIDHQLLYHLLLIPFTWFGNLIIAAKAAATFWAATALFAAYLLIRTFGNEDASWRRFDWIWPFILVSSSTPMLYRLSNTRVQSVSLLFLIVAIILIEKERYRWLLPLGFFYAWLYNGSVILVPITVLYVLTRWIMDRRIVWSPCLYSVAGLVAGFVLNPYFPENSIFLWKHLQEYLLRPTPVPVSLEWTEYSSWALFDSNRGAWMFMFTGTLALAIRGHAISRRSLTFFFINLLFLVMLFRAMRFVEYWPVFAVLFSASALQESRLSLLDLINASFQSVSCKNWKIFYNAISSGLIVALIAAALISAQRAITSIQTNAAPINRFTEAANWLMANTPKDSIVFNAQWDAFPDLFFHDHHNRWVAGLNEVFIYYLEPRLWHLYQGIGAGIVPDTARYILHNFRADYVLALKQSKGVTEAAKNPDNGLELAWEDKLTAIYRVHPSDRFIQIEGEYLPHPEASDGKTITCRREASSECRDYGNPSAGAFLLCEGGHHEAKLAWKIFVPTPGRWKVECRFPQGMDMGYVIFRINGQPVGEAFSLDSPNNSIGPFRTLGEINLDAGLARIEFFFTTPTERKRPFSGLDTLRFTWLTTPNSLPKPTNAALRTP
jgi:hypothetical protein